MDVSEPVLVLVGDDTTPSWRIEIRDLKVCSEKLGSEVLREFCRCFVHADRITSLTSYGYLSYQHYEEHSASLDRNIQTMLWFAIGTFRELALGLSDLRTVAVARGWYRIEDENWARLLEVEKRWKDDEFYRRWRSKVSFHVDPGMVERGIARLSDEGPAILAEGRAGTMDGGWLKLGLEALLSGAGIKHSEFERLIETASEDHDVAVVVQKVFCNVVEMAGLATGRA